MTVSQLALRFRQILNLHFTQNTIAMDINYASYSENHGFTTKNNSRSADHDFLFATNSAGSEHKYSDDEVPITAHHSLDEVVQECKQTSPSPTTLPPTSYEHHLPQLAPATPNPNPTEAEAHSHLPHRQIRQPAAEDGGWSGKQGGNYEGRTCGDNVIWFLFGVRDYALWLWFLMTSVRVGRGWESDDRRGS